MDPEENSSQSHSKDSSEELIKTTKKDIVEKQQKEPQYFPVERNSSLFKGNSFFGNKEVNPNNRINYYKPQIKPTEKLEKNKEYISFKEETESNNKNVTSEALIISNKESNLYQIYFINI